MVGHITYMSDDSMREKFGRRLREKENFGFGFDVDFEVESYLRYRGSQFVNRFDANSYLYITKAMDYFDLTNGHGSLAAALQERTGPLPGHQLQLGLAVSELPIAGNRARAAARAIAMWRIANCNPTTATTLFWWMWRSRRDLVRGFLASTFEKIAMTAQASKQAAFVRELLGRSDYAIIGEIVEPRQPRCSTWDAAKANCWSGWRRTKGVDARGVEISGAKVQRAIARGVSVYQGDIDEGLADYPDQAFDYVILSQTLQETLHPRRCCTRCCAWAAGPSWLSPISATGACACRCCSAAGRRRPSCFRTIGTNRRISTS